MCFRLIITCTLNSIITSKQAVKVQGIAEGAIKKLANARDSSRL
jgi:hypothetical protein